MIPVTKAYIPNHDKYNQYIDQILASGWLTNYGGMLQKLESRLANYLQVKHVICVANGSLALQVAYKALGLTGEVITTPFSFVATSSTLAWEGLTPVYADICPSSFNLDPHQITQHITPKTSAIVPVHVFGNPCDIDAIQAIADEHDLKVVYDASHAFGIPYRTCTGDITSVLEAGDISTISFHATKIFHTIEGGALITNDDALAQKIRNMINFGITGPLTIESLGTNAKMNEMQAAMGLCVLDEMDLIKKSRAEIWQRYTNALRGHVVFQDWNQHSENNHAYAPILFANEAQLLNVQQHLQARGIIPRRYFYPSLDTLYIQAPEAINLPTIVPVHSRSIASRIMCLPMYFGLTIDEQKLIIQLIIEALAMQNSATDCIINLLAEPRKFGQTHPT
tara:strand:- start:2773 stop:3957 length:1185 start_codon:yes stop_codon:yes gene_type:complete